MVAAVTKRFGRLDIVDHNAAWTSFRGDTDALGVDLEVWDRVFAVNTRGALHVARAAIPAMLAGGGGAICNITSGAGTIAEVRRVAYGASKAAIGQLTRHLAVAYGRQGIRANAVAPGLILTPSAQAGLGPEQIATIEAANPTGRAGTPRDIANVVVFLCSDAASYINGQTIHVDGGQLIAGRIPPAQGSEGVPGP
jgi:NAD(P)-dependent dehydrogenase (short-subunit alcohol dehydrogenase family)